MIVKDPAIRLIDVRSIAEYYFVGHPEMAANVPLTFGMRRRRASSQRPFPR